MCSYETKELPLVGCSIRNMLVLPEVNINSRGDDPPGFHGNGIFFVWRRMRMSGYINTVEMTLGYFLSFFLRCKRTIRPHGNIWQRLYRWHGMYGLREEIILNSLVNIGVILR